MTEEICLNDWGYKRYAERLQQVIDKGKKEYEYPLDPQNASFQNNLNKCMITEIEPTEFLALAAPKCSVKESSVDYLWDKFENQKKDLYPLYLDINPKDCRISTHEGRHRAEISKDLDIKKVPLKLCFIHTEIFKIKGQEFAGYESNELRKEIRDKGFSKEVVNKWMEEHNAYWEQPKDCNIDNVKGEATGVSGTLEIWDKEKKLRDDFGVNDLRNKWKRMI